MARDVIHASFDKRWWLATAALAAAPGTLLLASLATLWGRGPNGSLLPIDDVAHAAGTIGYELMCALARRVPVRAVA